MTVTFEQVTLIEAKRRDIERLQEALNRQAQIGTFGYRSGSEWLALDDRVVPLVREAVCKATIVQILKLLDDSEHLGVDVSESKKALAEFMQGLKPKEPA